MTLEVWRDGKAKALTATVGERERVKTASAGKPDASQGKLGVVVRPLTPEEQRESKLAGGVVVEDVGGTRREGRRASRRRHRLGQPDRRSRTRRS